LVRSAWRWESCFNIIWLLSLKLRGDTFLNILIRHWLQRCFIGVSHSPNVSWYYPPATLDRVEVWFGHLDQTHWRTNTLELFNIHHTTSYLDLPFSINISCEWVLCKVICIPRFNYNLQGAILFIGSIEE
jgi:hypothetical protein